MAASVVVFDIGGVLVDWQPHLAWMEDFGSEEAVRDYLERTDFMARNARADGGERFSDMAKELSDPDDAKLFTRYVERYELTVPNKLQGSWDILHALAERDVPVHAITNWSAETWPHGINAHPELGEVFGTTIVSGQEGIMKPDQRIFDLLCERAGVAPEDCVFIDDSEKNVKGAMDAGWDAIRFTDAPALRAALEQRGLL